MRIGRLPGQEEALLRRMDELVEERKRASRRMFLGLAVGGALGAAAGVGVARMPAAPALPQDPVRARGPGLDRLRQLAKGPLEDLLRGSSGYLLEADRFGEDETLWLGAMRIAHALAESDPRVPRSNRGLMRALKRQPTTPRSMKSWCRFVLEKSG